MAGILVLFKRVRPSTTVNFYVLTGALLDSTTAGQSYVVFPSQSFSNDSLTMVRSLYFPTANDYALWQGSSAMQLIKTDRAQYHQEHGITELEEVVHLNTI